MRELDTIDLVGVHKTLLDAANAVCNVFHSVKLYAPMVPRRGEIIYNFKMEANIKGKYYCCYVPPRSKGETMNTWSRWHLIDALVKIKEDYRDALSRGQG